MNVYKMYICEMTMIFCNFSLFYAQQNSKQYEALHKVSLQQQNFIAHHHKACGLQKIAI